MGIVNITPDSFYDGGRFSITGDAISRARQLILEGADIIDLGAESTRPGAMPVNIDDELQRLLPVLQALNGCGAVLSVDTQKPQIMAAAIKAGAQMINDVNGFQTVGAIEAVAGEDVGLCVMHKKGDPITMQSAPVYEDVVAEVSAFLRDRLHLLRAHGVTMDRIVIDPGFGFGKTLAHNIDLLRRLSEFLDLQVPLLVGLSRKSMLGKLTGANVEERLPASISAGILAVLRGAKILRVHDVAATKQALQILAAIQ